MIQEAQNNSQRVALVIGALGGLGSAIVNKFSSLGIHVLSADIAPTGNNSGKFVYHVDISQESSVQTLLENVLQNVEQLDVVVNCSGIMETPIDTTAISVENFRAIQETNLIGTFIVSKVFIPELLKSPAGRLIHFSSMLGAEGGPRLTAYSASKAAVIGMVKAMGKEYAKTTLTINAVAPAAIETNMLKILSPERKQQQVSLIPMGRTGTPEEVASLVSYIASPECSFTTGYVFDLSGGRSVY